MWTIIEIIFKDKRRKNKILEGVQYFHAYQSPSMGNDVYIKFQYPDAVGFVKLKDIDRIIVHYV